MAGLSTRCALCGSVFEASRSDARYCSDAHRARAHREAADSRRKTVTELLSRAAMIRDGDETAIAALRRDAERLLAA